MKYLVRWCLQSDLDMIASIELKSFEFPLEYDDFIMCLKREDHVGLVVEHEFKVVGFMLYQIKKEHYNLISIAVAPDFRRKNAGTALINYLKKTIKTRIKLIISDEKKEAHCFFKKNNFIAIKVLHEHFGPHHDGYEFVYDRVSKPKCKIKRGAGELG